jgi:hypothetical protein
VQRVDKVSLSLCFMFSSRASRSQYLCNLPKQLPLRHWCSIV